MLTKYLLIFLSLLVATLHLPVMGYALEEEPLVPNYPLQFVRHIYGKDKEGIDDSPEKGGTPVSCAQNSAGILYVLYSGNRGEIQAFSQEGGFLFRFGQRGDSPGQFSSYMCSLAINSNDEVITCDVLNRKILIFDKKGGFLREFSSVKGLGNNDPKQDVYPAHLSIGAEDRIYVSDGKNGHVWIYNMQGDFLGYIKGPEPGLFPSAAHIRFDSQGRIYILEGLANRIQVCSPGGEPLMCIGESGTRAGQFARISGIAIDKKNRVFISDMVLNVVQIFDSSGELIGVAKEILKDGGERENFYNPAGVFIDKVDLIYVIEQPLHRLTVFKDRSAKRGKDLKGDGM